MKALVQKLSLPDAGRIIAISDVHGNLPYLRGLLATPTTRGAAAAAKPPRGSVFPAWWATFLRRDRAGVLFARHSMPDVFSTTSAKLRKSPAAYVPP
mgnify:CR=1 FL=1